MRALLAALMLAACGSANALKVYEIDFFAEGGKNDPAQLVGSAVLTTEEADPHPPYLVLHPQNTRVTGNVFGIAFDSWDPTMAILGAASFDATGRFGSLDFYGYPLGWYLGPDGTNQFPMTLYMTVWENVFYARIEGDGIGAQHSGDVAVRLVVSYAPEPGAYALLLVGLGLLVIWRRRYQSSHIDRTTLHPADCG